METTIYGLGNGKSCGKSSLISGYSRDPIYPRSLSREREKSHDTTNGTSWNLASRVQRLGLPC